MAPRKTKKNTKKKHAENMKRHLSKIREIKKVYKEQKHSESDHGNRKNPEMEQIETEQSQIILDLDNHLLVDVKGKTIQRSLCQESVNESAENTDMTQERIRKGRSEKDNDVSLLSHKPMLANNCNEQTVNVVQVEAKPLRHLSAKVPSDVNEIQKRSSKQANITGQKSADKDFKKNTKRRHKSEKENDEPLFATVHINPDKKDEVFQAQAKVLIDPVAKKYTDTNQIRRNILRKRPCQECHEEVDSDIQKTRDKPKEPTENVTSKEPLNVDTEEPYYEIAIESNGDERHVDNPEGHRIIDIKKFIEDLQEISNHKSLFGCGLSTMKLRSEKQKGLVSVFSVSCQMCGAAFPLKSSSDDVNKNAVSGIMAAGCGHAQLNQFTAALDLPTVSEYMYNKAHNQVSDEWELTAWEEMKRAGERERNAAIEEGRVNEDGVPMIDVELDGCWCKRSYKSNYSASSGAAAIIGRRFGQVLFMSVKNKYCCICARAENRKETPKNHTCYKNYSGSSTSMEASIIVEGFKQSIDMHKVIYARFVADGDSNTYAKILEARPYPNITVEKVNCKNHVLRNFCNKLQLLKTDTRYSIQDRKLLTNERIMSSRKYITEAMQFHKRNPEDDATSKVQKLHKDINHSIFHGFGLGHGQCNKNICSRQDDENSKNPTFTSTGLWQRIRYHTAFVASHARSLIEVADSNRVESFNGVVAKFVGGKRVNLSQKRSYQARCAGAVVSFNSKRLLSTVKKHIHDQPPNKMLAKFEQLKDLKRERNRKAMTKKRYHVPSKPDTSYGEQPDKPDMDPATFQLTKETFLKNLEKTEEERKQIEKRTVLQSASGEWMELRRNLLTASNFGKVVKRIASNSCQNIVKSMLYKPDIDHVASISHGKQHEKTALIQLSSMIQKDIEPCGLFIDEKIPFLGATPDGVIPDTGTIVEVKCPVLPFKIGIDDAIKQNKMHFWKVDKRSGEIYVNKKSDWFIQIQGQLHITKADTCILAVWYGDNKIKTETIEKDDAFWYGTMEPKLTSFYLDCLLPELVDPRHSRNRPIRDPVYVKVKSKITNYPIKEPAQDPTEDPAPDSIEDTVQDPVLTKSEKTVILDFYEL